jgi:hypothetical protein
MADFHQPQGSMRRIRLENRNGKNDPVAHHTGLGVAYGVALGAAFGAAFNDVGLGVALGIAFGAAVGAGIGTNLKKKPDTSEFKK